jgi:hypothetical protein
LAENRAKQGMFCRYSTYIVLVRCKLAVLNSCCTEVVTNGAFHIIPAQIQNTFWAKIDESKWEKLLDFDDLEEQFTVKKVTKVAGM